MIRISLCNQHKECYLCNYRQSLYYLAYEEPSTTMHPLHLLIKPLKLLSETGGLLVIAEVEIQKAGLGYMLAIIGVDQLQHNPIIPIVWHTVVEQGSIALLDQQSQQLEQLPLLLSLVLLPLVPCQSRGHSLHLLHRHWVPPS